MGTGHHVIARVQQGHTARAPQGDAALAVLGSATAREIGAHTGLELVQVDRRLPEARKDGAAEVLQLNGEDAMRDGCRVWRLTEKSFAQRATNG